MRPHITISIRSCSEENWNPESIYIKSARGREEDSSEDDNERITRKFTMELEKAVREMKTNTVPGRDGLTVSFCKEF